MIYQDVQIKNWKIIKRCQNIFVNLFNVYCRHVCTAVSQICVFTHVYRRLFAFTRLYRRLNVFYSVDRRHVYTTSLCVYTCLPPSSRLQCEPPSCVHRRLYVFTRVYRRLNAFTVWTAVLMCLHVCTAVFMRLQCVPPSFVFFIAYIN